MGFSPSLTIYNLTSRVRHRGWSRAAASQNRAKRPPGALIWVHAPRPGDHGVIAELLARLGDLHPDVWFLLTTQGAAPENLPDQCFFEKIPPDTGAAAKAFLAHWKPDLIIWISGQLHPATIQQTALCKIPLIMLDTGAAFGASRRWFLLPGVSRTTLRKFDTILSGDEATSLALISAGALSDRVQTTGVLELDIPALACNEHEWSTLAEQVAARPVWLAAEINISELPSILAAHSQAQRRSHRLLLIIVPSDPEDGEEFTKILDEKAVAFTQRSIGGEPDTAAQIYLADTDEEMGLWYRLAPVTFMGNTFAAIKNFGPNPFHAAALGSVVLHGPNTGRHKVAYDRLGRAGASRTVAHMGEMAHTVEALLAPDRAAIMAHAAWQITSAGAEVMETTLTTLSGALSQSKANNE